MYIKDIINWVKGFFIEVKHEAYVEPTTPIKPWPYPVVLGSFPGKKPAAKKVAKKKVVVKKKPVAKKVAVKKPAVKKVTKKVK